MAKPAGQMVNDIGMYFYRHTDGAYKFNKSSNMIDIWLRIYYQIPPMKRPDGKGYHETPVEEMRININLTSYANKMRVNLIEVHPDEQTLGHFVVDTDKLQDFEYARNLIVDRLRKRLNKMFQGYEFIF